MKPGRVFVLALAALIIPLIGCVSSGKYQELEKKYNQDTASLQETIDLMKRKIGDLERSGIIDSQALQLAKRDLEQLAAERKELERELADIAGTRVSPEGGILMEGDYFFDPGMADIRKEAKASLDKLADLIAAREGRVVIVGHTDADPIVKSDKMWRTKLNHELGANRAVQVMAYMVGKGVSKDRFDVRSVGEFKPIAPNDTKDGKKKNRRVEIFLISSAPSK